MYLDFYGLQEPPFNLTPDSKFLFLSRRHEEALAALLYGVRERKGFICLSGEIGSGKTTLYRTLLASVDPGMTRTAVVLNSFLSDLELLKAINQEYGLPSESDSKKELLDALNIFLVEQFKRGVNCLLILDEAQNLRPETLEQVRMISNLETETDKLIQILMVGQPQLRQTLALPELEQLNQRITVRHHVTPLSEPEVGDYIRHRMQVARAQVVVDFSPQALRLIFHHSRGIPRRINVICDRCLLTGYVMSRHDIDGEMVQQSVDELRGELNSEEDAQEFREAQEVAKKQNAFVRILQSVMAGAALLAIVAGGVFLGATLKERGTKPVEGNRWLAEKPDPTIPAATEDDAESAAIATADPTKPTSTTSSAAPSAEVAVAGTEGVISDAGTTSTLEAVAPKRTPIPPDPWTLDRDEVVRVTDEAHTQAASFVMIARAWGMEIDLSTFGQADPEDVERFDLPAMMRQLDMLIFSTADLKQALQLDLPLIIRFAPGTEDFPPSVAVLRMQGDLFTVADPIDGIRTIERKLIEPAVEQITVLYRDPVGLTGLVSGAAGDPVVELQRIMARSGRTISEFDGKFGGKLGDLLRSFQRQNRLPVTGVVDPMTAAYIAGLREPSRPRLYS